MIYEGDLRANTNDDLLDCFAYDKIEGSLSISPSSFLPIAAQSHVKADM